MGFLCGSRGRPARQPHDRRALPARPGRRRRGASPAPVQDRHGACRGHCGLVSIPKRRASRAEVLRSHRRLGFGHRGTEFTFALRAILDLRVAAHPGRQRVTYSTPGGAVKPPILWSRNEAVQPSCFPPVRRPPGFGIAGRGPSGAGGDLVPVLRRSRVRRQQLLPGVERRCRQPGHRLRQLRRAGQLRSGDARRPDRPGRQRVRQRDPRPQLRRVRRHRRARQRRQRRSGLGAAAHPAQRRRPAGNVRHRHPAPRLHRARPAARRRGRRHLLPRCARQRAAARRIPVPDRDRQLHRRGRRPRPARAGTDGADARRPRRALDEAARPAPVAAGRAAPAAA